MFNLKGKRILVTGASSGIGYKTAIYLSQLGADLVITGRNIENLKECYKYLDKEKNNVLFSADLTNNEDIEALFSKIKITGDKLDGMVHCAGIPSIMPIKSLTREKLHSVFDINFYTFIELVRFFTKKNFSNDNSSIVVMSSLITRRPRAYELGYIASKAAIEASVPIIALEYQKRKIRINALLIGYLKTGMLLKTIVQLNNLSKLEECVNKTIHGWETEEEVANVIAFLLMDESKIITGRCIYADGGIF